MLCLFAIAHGHVFSSIRAKDIVIYGSHDGSLLMLRSALREDLLLGSNRALIAEIALPVLI